MRGRSPQRQEGFSCAASGSSDEIIAVATASQQGTETVKRFLSQSVLVCLFPGPTQGFCISISARQGGAQMDSAVLLQTQGPTTRPCSHNRSIPISK